MAGVKLSHDSYQSAPRRKSEIKNRKNRVEGKIAGHIIEVEKSFIEINLISILPK